MTVTLSPDQKKAIGVIESFIAGKWYTNRQFISLQGLAGTGKTFVLAELAKRHPNAILAAYTGKAAYVLQQRIGMNVSTIHSAFYDFRGLGLDDDRGIKAPKFDAREQQIDRLVMLDESSMIGTRVAEVLLNTGARIVAAGDPGQLPPVRDEQFFAKADVMLTNIHRQALDSPIIRQAHAVRNGGSFGEDGPEFRVVYKTTPDEFIEADMLLCYTNKTRQLANMKKRQYLGIEGPPRRGEPLVCMKNNHRIGILNGAVYELAADVDPYDPTIFINIDGYEEEIEMATIEGVSRDFKNEQYEEGWSPFAFGYALTVHRSQGSEWNKVILVDECFNEDRKAVLYTGITRAAHSIIVISR